MRIRSIKPEFWRSPDIAGLPVEDRLLFIGLWSYVDDNGVGIDRLASITADLFAGDLERDAPETFARVSRGLARLSEGGRIVRYTVDGTPYLEIVNWSKHQRIDKPGKERFPRSDHESAEIRDTVASLTETLAPGTGEQGNRGTEEQRNSSKDIALTRNHETVAFTTFWDVYPRRDDRRRAQQAFARALKRASVDEIVSAARRYAEDPNREDRFTKQAATWLNADSWENGPLPTRTPVSKQDQVGSFIGRLEAIQSGSR